eukprot:CAMPEP_0206259080 /NCGR_PEP_ID=MMETSP0047_2-20121206/26281_1 /ASSEMBLY_ACC=CAM_ASM_000192 /TAXON_ID=195065 /ORGANISM="Chroomonas mesostigmatica_cf, Strain CCMP1168" /LENGTH=87 /DNA_ID=CAMNT_0053685905 /DNA_START=185 /DNA_END=444 /DNA_ORIENTATION=+
MAPVWPVLKVACGPSFAPRALYTLTSLERARATAMNLSSGEKAAPHAWSRSSSMFMLCEGGRLERSQEMSLRSSPAVAACLHVGEKR